MGSTSPIPKPLVLVTATPYSGHLIPMRAVSAELVSLGYNVTFVAATSRRSWVESSGAAFFPLAPSVDFDDVESAARWADMGRNDVAPGPERLLWDLKLFVDAIPGQYESIQNALQYLTTTFPHETVVHINEGFYHGTIPLKLSPPGLLPSATISIGVIPVCLSSQDCAPFGPGLPPDASPAGRLRNTAMNEEMQRGFFAPVEDLFRDKLQEIGCRKEWSHGLFDSGYHLCDRFLQTTLPELEYPRSDAPKSLEYIGILPKTIAKYWKDVPSWWEEDVVRNEKKRKIIFVCQGTIARNYSDLIIPTLTALANRDDLLVVVALGAIDASLPKDYVVPSSARVEAFIPFEHILPYSSVFVTNGGYGGFMQAVTAGVPLVVAGVTEDKAEVSARVAWSGCGVDLKTNTAEPEAVARGVDEVLQDEKYKIRVRELMIKAAKRDPIGEIVRHIEELAAGAR